MAAAARQSRQRRSQSPKAQCSCLAWKRRKPDGFADVFEAPSPTADMGKTQAFGPKVHAFTFGDVREQGQTRDIGLIGFYFPGYEEPWDTICGASFCGNFYNLGPGGLELEAKGSPGVRKRFRNAEAAFQALKFWNRAEEFADLSGNMAFQKKRELSGLEDFTYAGFGSNWRGMWAVLQAKFKPGSRMAEALVCTGDAFLLEHNSTPGRDRIWSDNCDGEGSNWLGLQLMLLRDQLAGRHGWTGYLAGLIHEDSGEPCSAHGQHVWQSHVRSARQALVHALDEHLSARQGSSSVLPAR